MLRQSPLLITALTPILWGTTYLTTTALLPAHHPLVTALLRALPAGIILTLLARQLPTGHWWWRAAVLGVLNIGLNFALLFIAAYRLPGGVAATITSTQPLIVALLGWSLLDVRPTRRTIGAALTGIVGVSMLVLGAGAHLDGIGVVAAFGTALCTASGVVLTKRWGRPGSLLAFTGWQLATGGILLVPFALLIEGLPRTFTPVNVAGYIYLGLIGTAVAYAVWFWGIAKLPASSVAFLSLLVPIVATIAGFIAYRQSFTFLQIGGALLVIGSIIAAQQSAQAQPSHGTSHMRPVPRHALSSRP